MPLYLSIFSGFQVIGRGILIIPSINESSLTASLFRKRDLSLEWTGVFSQVLWDDN